MKYYTLVTLTNEAQLVREAQVRGCHRKIRNTNEFISLTDFWNALIQLFNLLKFNIAIFRLSLNLVRICT